MTGREDTGFGVEQPVPDVVDQRRDEARPTEQEFEPIEDIPRDANEADVIDQHVVVPVDEDPDPDHVS
jgi:hypothetical protein